MIKAIIWDMDGVLIDSEKHHINAEIATLKKYGVDLTYEFAEQCMGMHLLEFLKAVRDHYGVDFDVDEARQEHRKILKEYYREVFPLVPHAREVLANLDSQYLMGLSTTASRANGEAVLGKYGVLDYFKARTFGDEVARTKPDPEIFLRTAEGLGIEPAECVVIEDSMSGMRGAKDAGMTVIGRRAGHNKGIDFGLADYTVMDLLDVAGVLKQMG